MLDYNLFLRNMSGFGWYKPRFNVFFSELVMTSFLRFFSVPVPSPCVLKLSRTSPGLGPSKKDKKTGTGLDFKALWTPCGFHANSMGECKVLNGAQDAIKLSM
jgi:hypothetical protein